MSTSAHKLPSWGNPGFTLAEVLIAIAIFALLISIVMGSFSGVFTHTEALVTQRVNNAMARSCFMRIAADLANIYVVKKPFFTLPETDGEPSPYRFVAVAPQEAEDGVILQFASRAHVDLSDGDQEGIAVIRYILEREENRRTPLFRLRRSDVIAYDSELPEAGETDPILCENILALRFECLGAEGGDSEGWDSSSETYGYATPRAVKIFIELSAPEGSSVYRTLVTLPLWRSASGKV